MRPGWRWKWAALIAAVYLLVAVPLAIFVLRPALQAPRAAFERHLLEHAELLARALTLSPDPSPQDVLASLTPEVDSYVLLVDQGGHLVASWPPEGLPAGDPLSWPEVRAGLAGRARVDHHVHPTLGRAVTFAGVPLALGGEGNGVLVLALPAEEHTLEVEEARRRALAWGIGLGGLALALLAGGLWFVRLNRSLESVVERVQALAAGDMSLEFLPPVPIITPLAFALNSLLSNWREREAAMDSAVRRLWVAMENMPDGVLIVDAEGRVQLANSAARSMLGSSQEHVEGESLVVVARDYQIVDVWRRSVEGGTSSEPAEIQLHGRALLVSSIPIRGASAGARLLMLQDLTDLRRVEEVRRDFISNVSHELRTPLASLKALAETLREGALEDPPAARRFLDRMEMEVDALVQLVSELLELSRIESGQVPFHFEPAHPREVLVPPLERLRPQIDRAGLSVSFDIPAELPLVRADIGRIHQVVTNLVHNAIKFTPAGGRITLLARQEAERVVFAVSDTGLGIAPEQLPRIFERFYKGDRARATEGTGLGLAIAKHIIMTHHGEIWAESQEGKGSVFLFTLPQMRPADDREGEVQKSY